MEFQRPIPIANQPIDEIIETIETCFLCGHKLSFIQVTDFRKNEVQEDARCTACGVKQKTLQHVLQ